MSDYYRNKPQLSVQYLKSWDCKMIFVFNLISKNTQNSYESFLKQLEYFLNLAYKLQTFHFSFVGCCIKHLLLKIVTMYFQYNFDKCSGVVLKSSF